MNINVKKWSKPVIIAIALITGLQAYWASTLQFDYNFETLFPTEDPELAFFQKFRETFADDNEYLSVGLHESSGVFQKAFLQKLDSCTKQLERLNQVVRVSSPSSMKFLKFNLWGRKKQVPLLHVNEPAQYKRDSSYIYQQPDLLHNFFSEDGKSVCVYLQIQNNLAHTTAGDSLLLAIHNTIQRYSFEEYHVLGSLQSQQENTRKVKSEFYLFTSLSMVLVVVFLFLTFRSLWGVIVPLIVIGLCGLWALGTMGALNVEVNLMTMMIPTIIFVVAMSDVIHLLSKYLDELRLGKSQEEALQVTIKEVGLATFMTSITTALGFLTLLSAGVKPFVQFGVFAAIGVLLAFIITFSVLPAILIQLQQPVFQSSNSVNNTWNKWLGLSFYKLLKRQKLVFFLSLVVVLFAGLGVYKLDIHAYFSDEINKNDPLSQDIKFFEQEFGGIRPFEICVSLKDSTKSFWELDLLRNLENLERYLKDEYQVNKLYSLTSVLKAANRSLMGGDGHFYRLPSSDKRLQTLIDKVRAYNGESLQGVITDRNDRVRISGSIHDIGSRAVEEKNGQLKEFIAQHINTELMDVKLTGSATMIDRSHQIMSVNMLQGLGFALLVVSLMMGILYKNPKAIIIALIPNVLPLVVIAGFLGWMGIGLNMSTSIIFTIAFGIAVDDTIHFMTKLNIELNKGLPLIFALKKTFIATGKAIILTSIMLSSGFFVMVLSDFNGTFYMGFLVGLTLVVAVLVDLLLIPLLVMMLRVNRENIKPKS